MFLNTIAVIFITYAILILFSTKDGISKQVRQALDPEDLERLQNELDYREYWAVLLLLFGFLILLPKLIMW